MGKKWEEILKQIDEKVEEERKIWSHRLKEKIEELTDFKQEMLKLREPSVDLLKSREDRLRNLEIKLEQERVYILEEETSRRETEEKLHLVQKKLAQLEKENEYFQNQLSGKTGELNDLRIHLTPYLKEKNMSESERIDNFEEQLEETQNFYKRISKRIDNLLKY